MAIEAGATTAAAVLQPGERVETSAARCRGERGAISPFIMVLLPALVGLVGLAYDGGTLFAARREAINTAAAAARAGANDVTEESVYLGRPELAPTAGSTATGFAYAQGADVASARQLREDLIEVTVEEDVAMTFLGLFGIGPLRVDGDAIARVEECCDA